MSKITLASINESLEAIYGSFEVELDESNTVVLLHPIRLSKEKRDALAEAGNITEDEEDVEGHLVGIIRAAAESDAGADKLIAALSPRGYPDLAALGNVVAAYMEDQKVGEASAS